ncbi:MAG: hypothetical protein NTZ48_07695, partial [Candidatus Omnitrophica bacterium]|nr:hypothetical protein [Candidatus Omnitrophota bacterium]
MVVQIVVTINYLSYAMVLVKSLRRQGGAFTYSILLTDVSRKGMREVYEILIAEGIEVICCDDLEIEYLEKMRKYYSALEFNAACKILAIDFQLKKKHAKECLCLDADIYALGSVEKVLV